LGKEYKGMLLGQGLRFAIAVSRFNELVTSRLLEGARDALIRHGVNESDIDVAWTTGSLELPLLAKKMAKSGRYAAIICLGAIIRGETPHFEYVASQASAGIANVSLETEVAVIFGVLTTNNLEEAMDRAGGKQGNKGFDAALRAIEVANLLKSIEQE